MKVRGDGLGSEKLRFVLWWCYHARGFGEMNFSPHFLHEELVWDDRDERCPLDWKQVGPLAQNGLRLRTCWSASCDVHPVKQTK